MLHILLAAGVHPDYGGSDKYGLWSTSLLEQAAYLNATKCIAVCCG